MEWYHVNVLGSRMHKDVVAKLLSEAFTRYS